MRLIPFFLKIAILCLLTFRAHLVFNTICTYIAMCICTYVYLLLQSVQIHNTNGAEFANIHLFRDCIRWRRQLICNPLQICTFVL